MKGNKTGPQAAEAMFRRGLEALVSGSLTDWIDMWDEAGVIEFPFAPRDYLQGVSGKSSIAAYMRDLPKHLEFARFPHVRFHHSVEGNVMVVEFNCEGRAVASGRPYNQRYVAVIELTPGGRISAYRDYWNPLVAAEALGDARRNPDEAGVRSRT